MDDEKELYCDTCGRIEVPIIEDGGTFTCYYCPECDEKIKCTRNKNEDNITSLC